MKIPFFFIIILTTVASFGLSTSAKANPTARNQVVANSSYAANGAAASAKSNPGRVPTNMGNYWDANQWDREGGASFWHATTESKGQTNEPKTQKQAKKGGRLVKKFFKR